MLGHVTVSLFLIFWGNLHIFQKIQCLHSWQQGKGLHFSICSTNVCYLCSFWWQLFYRYIQYAFLISLMIKYVEHLFICLLTICCPFFKMCICTSAYFFNRWCVFFKLSCMSSLCILDITLYWMHYLQIYSSIQ